MRNVEQLLLSSVLRDKDYPHVMTANITRDMFSVFGDQFEFINNYYSQYRKTPTKIAFKAKFPDFHIVLCNDTPHFCTEVVKAHARRLMLASLNEASDHIAAGDPMQAASVMHKQIVSITAQVGSTGDVDILSDFEAIFTDAQEKANRVAGGGYAGIPSGFDAIDDLTGGCQPGEFHAIGGRQGEGKTWIAMKWAATALAYGKRVQFNTLEMSRPQVAYRMHTLLSGASGKRVFSNTELQQGKNFDPKAYRAFLRSLKTMLSEKRGGSFYVTDGSRGRINPMTIAAQIERNAPDLVIIDLITLMEGASGDWKNITALTGDLKSLAQQYQVPIIGTAQLNRERGITTKGMPGTEAFAQSDSIGQDTDGAVMVRKLSEHVLQARIAKNRHGRGNVKFYIDFRPSDGIIEQVSYDQAMTLKDADIDAESREMAEPKRQKTHPALMDDETPTPKRSQTPPKRVKRAPRHTSLPATS